MSSWTRPPPSLAMATYLSTISTRPCSTKAVTATLATMTKFSYLYESDQQTRPEHGPP
ncbi:hypothetical protein FIBSPDRAFT_877128 [Athelia psychrophila]|uniref:Uncharacterized protein n=1 Tax=Athelia psychrophila TaxID=1759441 RepID=A0A167W7V3_9AGAM|nr:hypothetical protein FIBSPDRAFT_877128 [Fibularhizoctonia sp. CBS 109695]